MREGTHEDTITMLERLQEENEELRKRITTLEVTNKNYYEELKLLHKQRKQLFHAIHWVDVPFEKDDETFEIDIKAPLMIWKGWTEEDFEGDWWEKL